MPVFKPVEIPHRTFFQKLMGRWPEGYAWAALNNLLASKPLKEITLEEVNRICRDSKTDLYATYSDQLRDLYKEFMRHCLADHHMPDDEVAELRHLKALLVLNDNDIMQVHNELASEIYQSQTEEAVADGRLTPAEEEHLEQLAHELMLPAAIAKKISADVRTLFVQNYIKDSTSDKRLSDDELKELDAISKSLSATVTYDDATKALLDKYRLMWCIENGTLPEVAVDINLQRYEKCYFSMAATWLENRSVTRSVRYGGPAVSVRIAKGLYYRAGGYTFDRTTSEELKLIDSGTLYVTSKRLIFVGASRNTNIRLEKILSLNPSQDGIEVVKDAGRNPFFSLDRDPEMLLMILARVIEDKRRSG
jgi:hypothetical protein